MCASAVLLASTSNSCGSSAAYSGCGAEGTLGHVSPSMVPPTRSPAGSATPPACADSVAGGFRYRFHRDVQADDRAVAPGTQLVDELERLPVFAFLQRCLQGQ